jgi:hypothetical protein
MGDSGPVPWVVPGLCHGWFRADAGAWTGCAPRTAAHTQLHTLGLRVGHGRPSFCTHRPVKFASSISRTCARDETGPIAPKLSSAYSPMARRNNILSASTVAHHSNVRLPRQHPCASHTLASGARYASHTHCERVSGIAQSRERASGICLAERVQRAARIARQEVADERGQRVGAQAEVTARHDRLEAPLPLRVGPNQKHLPPPPPLRARAAERTCARTCLAKHGRTARHSSRASPTNMFAFPLGARLTTARATLVLRLGALALATLADTGRPWGVSQYSGHSRVGVEADELIEIGGSQAPLLSARFDQRTLERIRAARSHLCARARAHTNTRTHTRAHAHKDTRTQRHTHADTHRRTHARTRGMGRVRRVRAAAWRCAVQRVRAASDTAHKPARAICTTLPR